MTGWIAYGVLLLPICFLIVTGRALGVRIRSEERQVAARYPGYVDYARRTRRLIPWIL